MKRTMEWMWRTLSNMTGRIFGARIHQYLFFLYQYYLRGGCLRVWRFRRNYKACDRHIRLSVCAIMKNEGPYLREWIEFHLAVGVERFFLYANDCSDDTVSIARSYEKRGLVELVEVTGEKMQHWAYEDCLERHHADVNWIAFIDLDEFLVPMPGCKIVNYLEGLPKSCSQVLVPWLFFGSNGHEKYLPRPVIERFTRRGTGCNREGWQVKSIVRIRQVYETAIHTHFVCGRTVTTDISTLRLHHYFCKSWEEYSKRAKRGEACGGAKYAVEKYTRNFFDARDLNEVEDVSALYFLPLIGERVGVDLCASGPSSPSS